MRGMQCRKMLWLDHNGLQEIECEGLTVLRDNDIAEGYAPSIQELSRRIHILGGTTVPSKGSSAGGESSCGSIYALA